MTGASAWAVARGSSMTEGLASTVADGTLRARSAPWRSRIEPRGASTSVTRLRWSSPKAMRASGRSTWTVATR